MILLQSSFQEDSETWTKDNRTSTPQSVLNARQETVTVKAQVHRSQSPPKKGADPSRKSNDFGVRKISVERKIVNAEIKRPGVNKSNAQNNFTNVLSELKNRKSSTEGPANIINSKGVPPPPPMPPPLESHDPSESRPFLDPYGRAKTVRIGKWR